MTREESKMMQGVAILIMIFYHLFNPHDAPEYEGTIIGGLAMANNPVPFYVLLSGYGLYKSFFCGGRKTPLSRCVRLYLHYWVIMTSFLLLGFMMNIAKCHFSFFDISSNYLGLRSTYYLPAWFVLPYCIIVLISHPLFKLISSLKSEYTILMFYLIYIIASFMNRYEWFRWNIFQTLYILFPFVLGAILAKTQFIEKIRNRLNNFPIITPVFLLFGVVLIRYYVYTGAIVSFYVASFIILFLVIIQDVRPLKIVFIKLGRASLNMWMIHAWICWYLFRDTTYSMGNPLLIYLFVLLLSYFLAIVFNYIISYLTILYRMLTSLFHNA